MPKLEHWKQEYFDAHEGWFARKYPTAYKDGHYAKPAIPPIRTANGLTKFILNYIMWSGYRATRISSTGRKVGNKWIYGTTRKGTADISCTIAGRSVMIEIKVGNDRASEYQLAEQRLERQAGGIYEFISLPEQFIELYKKLTNDQTTTTRNIS
jgi:hypothetical protein